MPRFTKSVTAKLRELRELLGVIDDGIPSVLPAVLPELSVLLRAKACAYGVQVEDQGYSMSFGHFASFGMREKAAREIFGVVVRSPKRQLGFYTPARIEHWQRNLAVAFPSNAQVLRASVPLPKALGAQMGSFEDPAKRAFANAFTQLGLEDEYQLRALVCGGSSLLAWMGAFRAEPYQAQDRRILQALVPALRRRLEMESHWDGAALHAQAVPVLLDRIPSAALIVSASGRIEHANALARRALALDPRELRSTLRQALKGRQTPSVQLTRISTPGWPVYFLAVVAGPSSPVGRTELARRRWNLTRREAETLTHLASGASNRVTAALMDCAVRTVEQHVTRVLEKMQVENRATAIARFWSELTG